MDKIKDALPVIPFQTDKGRYYRVGDQVYPSVTTILEKTASPEEQERLR